MDWRLASLAGLGGAVGAIARYGLSGWVTRGDFPSGTLLVNLVGCFLIGVLMFGGLAGGWLSPQLRIVLGMGLLGGFTTMSTFTYDTVTQMVEGEHVLALTNVSLTVVGGLAATWLGRVAGLALWSGGA